MCLSPPRPATGQLKSYCTRMGPGGDRGDLRAEVNPRWAVEGHVCDVWGISASSLCWDSAMTGLAWANSDKKITVRSPDGLQPPVCLPGPQEAPHLSLPPTMPGLRGLNLEPGLAG